MITNHYSFVSEAENTLFPFQSEGENGIFDMAVEFQKMSANQYNLALGVYDEGEFRDDLETNNGDFWKIMSTVAAVLFEFFRSHPAAVVQIRADEQRRLRVYNGIFQKRKADIERHFKISGMIGNIRSPFDPNRFYDGFEIKLKHS
ncbi:MAG: hypothetical protein AAB316_17695 [Bacteroidota bacterium]